MLKNATSFANASAVIAAAGVSITYQGTLLSAPAVTGPWAPVLGATSPFTPTPGSGQAFFKAQK